MTPELDQAIKRMGTFKGHVMKMTREEMKMTERHHMYLQQKADQGRLSTEDRVTMNMISLLIRGHEIAEMRTQQTLAIAPFVSLSVLSLLMALAAIFS